MPKQPTKPTEARQLDWQKLLDEALTLPGNLGSVYSRFYNYSFMNCLLLSMQGIHEPVATYNRWQSMGRQVLKGSKAAEIVRPIIIDKKNAAGELEDRTVRFKLVKALFTVSQTDGAELPPVELPHWDLGTALKTLDVKQVPFISLDGNAQGYSFHREYAINPVAVNPAKTTMHELGHIMLGHTTDESLAEYAEHRGVKEFQAEATAYLTMNELEQLSAETASQSRGYIQGWLGNERPTDLAIRQVFTSTDQILRAGRAQEAEMQSG